MLPAKFTRLVFTISVLAALAACAAPADTPSTTDDGSAPVRVILGAYTTPREAYGQLIPIFTEQWKAKTGQTVTFEESYQGSGAQSRAIVEGFEADIAALSLQADVDRIVNAGLITHDWRAVGPSQGMVSTSVVAFAVRPGNPENIQDWADLARPGLEVLTPNPKTSGGAQWNILALYGAALRGQVAGVAADDPAAATEFLKAVLKNVSVMDKAARDSMTTFEKGVGDVAITYENEVLVGRQAGQEYDLVIPRSTLLIENPIAVIDTHVDKHGARAVAEAFVEFVFTPEAQAVFAQYGLRSIDAGVAQATAAQYPPVADLFTIEFFGGWSQATPAYFGDDGIYSRAIAEVQAP